MMHISVLDSRGIWNLFLVNDLHTHILGRVVSRHTAYPEDLVMQPPYTRLSIYLVIVISLKLVDCLKMPLTSPFQI